MTLRSQSISIRNIMSAKEQVVFDIKSEEFRYLHRSEDKIKNKVNIDVLNARLNKVKRLNIYSTVKIIILATGVLLLFTIIIVKF